MPYGHFQAKYVSTLFHHGNLRKLSDKITELQDLAAGKLVRYKRDGYGSYEESGEQLTQEQQVFLDWIVPL